MLREQFLSHGPETPWMEVRNLRNNCTEPTFGICITIHCPKYLAHRAVWSSHEIFTYNMFSGRKISVGKWQKKCFLSSDNTTQDIVSILFIYTQFGTIVLRSNPPLYSLFSVTVDCEEQNLVVTYRPRGVFRGRVYVPGRGEQCSAKSAGGPVKLTLPLYGDCDVNFAYAISNSPNGVVNR